MLRKEFDELTDKFLKECHALCGTKGSEYSGSEDCLSNFKRHAEALGLKPSTVLMVYMAKHWDSISTFAKRVQQTNLMVTEATLSEPITSRLQDLVNYAILLHALLEEERNAVHKA